MILCRERLETFLAALPRLRIAVAGDLFLDKWLEIDRSLDEASVETGLTAYQVIKKRVYAGAAGTVLSNLAALETGKLYAIGFTGDDGEGFELRRELAAMGIDTGAVKVSPGVMTPAYTKPVFLRKDAFGRTELEETHRLDHRNIKFLPSAIEDYIIDSLHAIVPRVDAIIALDQLTVEGFGVLSPRVREALTEIAAANPKLIVYADSRAFISKFRGMIIKCNDHEAVKIVYPQKTVSPEAAVNIEEAASCFEALLAASKHTAGGGVFISCGSRGILAKGRDGKPLLVPALPIPGPVDIVGAGDACSAGIVAALCAGAEPEEAAAMGNITASIAIQVIGSTGTADRSQVRARYLEAESLYTESQAEFPETGFRKQYGTLP